MSDDPQLPAPAKTELATFAPSLTVVGPDERKFEVAVNAAANRAFAQITVSRVRAIINRKLTEIEEAPNLPDALTLARIISTVTAAEEMAALAYEGKKTLSEKESSEFERLALGVVGAAAQGAAAGATDAANNHRERLRKIKELGRTKRAKKVQPTVIDAQIIPSDSTDGDEPEVGAAAVAQ